MLHAIKTRTLRLYNKDLLRYFYLNRSYILCTHSIVSMFIQVGGVGYAEYDLLADHVGGQVTKPIYLSIMTRLIWVGVEYGFLPQTVGAQVKQANLFCDEPNLF